MKKRHLISVALLLLASSGACFGRTLRLDVGLPAELVKKRQRPPHPELKTFNVKQFDVVQLYAHRLPADTYASYDMSDLSNCAWRGHAVRKGVEELGTCALMQPGDHYVRIWIHGGTYVYDEGTTAYVNLHAAPAESPRANVKEASEKLQELSKQAKHPEQFARWASDVSELVQAGPTNALQRQARALLNSKRAEIIAAFNDKRTSASDLIDLVEVSRALKLTEVNARLAEIIRTTSDDQLRYRAMLGLVDLAGTAAVPIIAKFYRPDYPNELGDLLQQATLHDYLKERTKFANWKQWFNARANALYHVTIHIE
jgi:hypothetical protein